MNPLPPPPAGSRLTVEVVGDVVRIQLPPIHNQRQWGAIGFLCFWLCGWLVGECVVLFMLFEGIGDIHKSWPVMIFLTAWLGGWTFGGIGAIGAVRGLLRKSMPGLLVITPAQLDYTTSGGPDELQGRRYGSNKPIHFSIARDSASAPMLDWIVDHRRLSIDKGCDRIEIGAHLSEPEKEWLFDLLTRWQSNRGTH